MPNKLFWLPLPVERWLAEIAGALLPEQEGALLRLSCVAWVQTPPCTLPNNDAYLASKSGLGTRWKKLAPEILSHFQPTEDGTRLVCVWAKEIYDEQLRRYELRKHRNDRHRKRDAKGDGKEASHGASPQPSHRASRSASHPASQNGVGDVSLSRAKNLELRSTTEPSNEGSCSTAPKARASADEARAAPGAPVETGTSAPGDDPASGPAVDTRRGGGPPTSLTDVLNDVVPSRHRPRKAVLEERNRALAWAQEHPDEATRIETELRAEWPKVTESMLVSAFVKALHDAGKTFPVSAHAEVSP